MSSGIWRSWVAAVATRQVVSSTGEQYSLRVDHRPAAMWHRAAQAACSHQIRQLCEFTYIPAFFFITEASKKVSNTHIHTHTRLTVLFPGLPGWAGTRKVKPIWILLKQETVSGSGISWAICKFAPCSRQITMPAPHHSVFLQAGGQIYKISYDYLTIMPKLRSTDV